MGWSSGSELLGEVVGAIQENVKDASTRKKIYRQVIRAFESFDCDTINECCGSGPVFDELVEE